MEFELNEFIDSLDKNIIVDIAVCTLFPELMSNIKWVSVGCTLDGWAIVSNDNNHKGYELFGKKLNAFLDCMNTLETKFISFYNDDLTFSGCADPTETVTKESKVFHRFIKTHPVRDVDDARQFIQDWINK